MELLLGLVMVIVVLGVVLIPIITISSILNGYVLSVMWGWFIGAIVHHYV
jgi:hypothetical protein